MPRALSTWTAQCTRTYERILQPSVEVIHVPMTPFYGPVVQHNMCLHCALYCANAPCQDNMRGNASRAPPLSCSLVLVTANNSEHHSPSVAEHVERSVVEHGGPCVGEHCELSVGEHCERSAGSVVGLALVSILCLALVSNSSAALQRFGRSLTNHFGRHSRKTLRP